MTFVREDWIHFRSVSTITQRAGVTRNRLPRLVVKELADNAYDVAGACDFGPLKEIEADPDGGVAFYVEDCGSGIPGTDEQVAELFSIGRRLTSSKSIRLPTRGALGNGLRVVAGVILASGGSLVVNTSGRSLTLEPQDDGTTKVAAVAQWRGVGTRIEVRLGPSLDVDDNIFAWAGVAKMLASQGTTYLGRSSAYWYDSDGCFELLRSAPPDRTVGDLVGMLEGCGGKKTVPSCAGHAKRLANSLSRSEATEVLRAARERSREVKPCRLGCVGRLDNYAGYDRTFSSFRVRAGEIGATIPVVVEVWARRSDRPKVTVCVNRTPVCANVGVWRAGKKNEYTISGCGLCDDFTVTKAGEFELLVNIQSPHMPLVTDGKEPDLNPLREAVLDSLSRAAKLAHRKAPKDGGPKTSIKAVVLCNLETAIDKVSGDRRHRYSLRQLFYAIRPYLLDAFGEEPDYGWFSDIIKGHERELGHDLPGIYRDNRGVLYHPHLRQEIPLGTRMVENYARPAWVFNKVLYCEKEGLFPLLQDVEWPERHDCALLTSKGFATFAARDLLDLLDQSGEPITVFCVHDADGPGSLIYQELCEGVRDRSGREIRVVNLGLEPAEAVEMGLVIEPVNRKDGKRVGVADYVEEEWREWLQSNRSELNSMTSPGFLAWLDRKIAPYDTGKVIPPAAVMEARLKMEVRDRLRREITERVLREANVDAQVERATSVADRRVKAEAKKLNRVVPSELARTPSRLWADVIGDVADRVTVGHGARPT